MWGTAGVGTREVVLTVHRRHDEDGAIGRTGQRDDVRDAAKLTELIWKNEVKRSRFLLLAQLYALKHKNSLIFLT